MEDRNLDNARVGGWQGLVDLAVFLFVTVVVLGAVGLVLALRARVGE